MMQRRTAGVMAAVLRHGHLMSNVKLLFVLRNPVKRAFSGLPQLVGRVTPQEFHEMAKREIAMLKLCYPKTMSGKDEECPHGDKTGDVQQAALAKCVEQNNIGETDPWFQRFNFNYKPAQHSRNRDVWRYEGVLLRG